MADVARVRHSTKPGVALNPVQGVEVLAGLGKEVINSSGVQGVIRVPVSSGELGNPYGLSIADIIVGRPDVVVEVAQALAVPVEGVEVDVAAAALDVGQEALEPSDALGGR